MNYAEFRRHNHPLECHCDACENYRRTFSLELSELTMDEILADGEAENAKNQ